MSGNFTQSAARNVSVSLLRPIVFLLIILAAVALGYLSLSGRMRERLAGLFSLEFEVAVEVAQAHKVTMSHSVTGRGEILPIREVRISAAVPGIIKEMRYEVGDKVATGALVAVIEPRDLAARLAAQEAAIEEAEALTKNTESQLMSAEKTLAALRDLFQKDLIARREVELAEAAAITARARSEAAEAQLAQRISLAAQTRQILRLARVVAPAAGFVSRRWAEPGARVVEATPLLSVAQGDELKILLALKTTDTETIGRGTQAQIVVDELPGEVIRGKVTRVEELANFSGDESSVEIEIPNRSGMLKVGMKADVALLARETRDGVFVPKQALLHPQGRQSELFVVENGRARRRLIVSGREHESQIEVVSGVQPGEVVAVKGIERLRDGSRVMALE